MTYALVVALMIALGVIAAQAAGLIYFAREALRDARGKGASDTKAAATTGALAIANAETGRANESTAEIAEALTDEQRRSELLEKEAADASSDPVTDPWKRLQGDELEKP